MKYYCLIFILFFVSSPEGKYNSSEINDGERLNVYFRTSEDLVNYFRLYFNYINYVRDVANADVSILIVSHTAANQGKSYRIIFNGENEFDGLNDTLGISFQQTDSEETEFNGLLKIVRAGLVRYVAHAGLLPDISVEYPDTLKNNLIFSDNWDYWFFNIASSGEFQAEESKKEYNFEGNAEASRVTHDLKVVLSFDYNREIRKFDVNEGTSESDKVSAEWRGLYVHSLGDHFSAGVNSNISQSTFINTKLRTNIGPAVEYSFFPYALSMSREFIFRYRLDYIYQSYFEPTIFNKVRENLLGQSLTIKYEIKEIWGSVSFSLYGFHYMSEFSQNRLEFSTDLSLRIFEGFAIVTELEANLIHDQIYLPAKGASLEEILLNQKELASQYEFKLSFGFSYSFGSIYNNVVNTRF